MRTWQEHLDNDVWYVEHVSLATDIMMCFRLVQYALDRKSFTARSDVKTGTFMGYGMDGMAINMDGVPQKYVEKEFMEAERVKEA